MRVKTIALDLIPFEVTLIITKDINQVKKFVNKYFETNHDTEDLKSYEAITFKHSGYSPVIWLKEKPQAPSQYATFAHEVFHAVHYITQFAGIRLSDDSEEIFSYMLELIMKKLLK